MVNVALVHDEGDLILQSVQSFLRFRVTSALTPQRSKLLLKLMEIVAGFGAVVVAFQVVEH
jgi:hypothetical protein